MATDGPGLPPPCDQEIFEKGQSIAALDGRSYAVERWVRKIAEQAQARIDWHYSGGVAHVLHLGDEESHRRVVTAMRLSETELDGHIIRFYGVEDEGLYKQGVTEVPEGAIATFYDGGTEPAYLVEINPENN